MLFPERPFGVLAAVIAISSVGHPPDVFAIVQSPSIRVHLPEVLNVHPGYNVTIDGEAIAGTNGTKITEITWDWNDSQTSTGGFPQTHHYSKPGNYAVKISAFNGEGLKTSITIGVIVPPVNLTTSSIVSRFTALPPQIVPFFTAVAPYYVDNQITFDAKPSVSYEGNLMLYHWDFGDGHQEDTKSPIDFHVYTQESPYEVTLTVFDSLNESAMATDTITVTHPRNFLEENESVLIAVGAIGSIAAVAIAIIPLRKKKQ